MAYVIKLRRDTAGNWTSANPTLAAGEAGFETDTNKLKVGDGTTAWTSLGYISATASADIATATFWNAKGDLAAATGNDAAAVLPVGTANQALVVDSTTATGLKWAGIVNSVAGTTNEVTVSSSTGSVTIGLPDEVTVIDLNTDKVDFNLTPASTTIAQGRILWDATDKTLMVGLNSNVTAKVAQNLYKYVHNDSGSQINKGNVVYIHGGHASTSLTIRKAQANAESTSSTAVGVTAEDIANGTDGFVIVFGTLSGITTNTITGSPSEGDALYLDESTAGALRKGLPAAPNHGVRIGFLVKSAGSGAGAIFVNVQNYQELEELSDVTITSAASNDFLVYDTNKWVNKTASTSRTALGLGTLATQSGTFSGTSSGTNTGDQNIFQTIAVAGQSNVVADSTTDTLTFIAGSNMTITTNATNDEITFASSGGGGTPGGTANDIQYNDGTGFAGTNNLEWDNAATTLGVNGKILLKQQSPLRFEEGGAGTNYVAFAAPSSIAADILWTLPSVDGSSGQVLSTDGSGTLSWATAAGSVPDFILYRLGIT